MDNLIALFIAALCFFAALFWIPGFRWLLKAFIVALLAKWVIRGKA